MSERTIFLTALDIADPAERRAYLDEACAGDAALRRQVEALLAAHEREGDFLDVPAVEQFGASPEQTQAAPPNREGGGAGLAFLAPSRKPDSLGRLDHYEVQEVLGHGGMGVVFRALDEKLRRVVAIKVLAPHLAASGTARQRFVREAQAAAAVRDEHVVDIHAVEDSGPIPYLVMEYIDGIPLDERIKQGGALEVKEVLRIGLQAAKGLAAAHEQGLIHRDVKPGNILLENSVQRVKITDFGLARAVDDASLTQSGVVAGTPLYMSPEQARGEALDGRSDLFSLGSVLYAMCTGRPPFRAESTLAVLKRVCEDTPRPIHEVTPEVPGWLEAIVAKLHAKDPAQRFQSAAEVAELLGKHLAHLQQPSLAPRPATVEVPAQASRRRKPALAAAAAVLVAVGALTTYLILRKGEPAGSNSEEGEKKEKQEAHPFVPRRPLTAEELAKLPSPLDGRKRDDIPRSLLALAGGGDPAQAPPELVAVLGDSRFTLPRGGLTALMAACPDGKLLAVPCGNEVVLFDARTGSFLRALTGHTGRVYAVAFSPDGKSLAAGSWDGDSTVRVWNVETGGQTTTCPSASPHIARVAFSPDGKLLAGSAENGQARIWAADTGEVRRELPAGAAIRCLTFSPNGKTLVCGAGTGAVTLWDLEAEKEPRQLRTKHATGISVVAFTRDGKLLATGGEQEFKLWDSITLEEVCSRPTGATWLAFHPDGTALLTAGDSYADNAAHTVTRWEVSSGKELDKMTLASRGGAAVFHLSPDGTTLFGMRCEPVEPFVHAYDAATGKELFPRQGHTGYVYTVAISPDGRTLASGGEDHTVRLWDLAGWRAGDVIPPVRTLARHTDVVRSVAFSPDGKLLASGSFDSTIVLWNVVTGQEVRTLTGHSKVDSLLAFSPDGQTLAAGGQDNSVKLWDVATGKSKEPLRWHSAVVRAVAFSPDGQLLASAGHDQTVQVCEATTGRRVDSFRAETCITSVAFAPDSRTLAAACGEDGPKRALLFLRDLATKTQVALPGHTGTIEGLACHPGGHLVATAGHDRTVRFWGPLSDGTKVLTVDLFGGVVRQVAFTPEGRYLATANENGTIAILRVAKPPGTYAPGSPKKLPEPAELAKRPSPADALKREDIPEELLKKAAGGKPDSVPELVAVLGTPEFHLPHMVHSPDGKILALPGPNAVVLRDARTGKHLRTLTGLVGDPEADHSVAFSPDGKRLAAGAWQGGCTAAVWDTDTGRQVTTFRGHQPTLDLGISSVAFSPDGKRIVTGGADETVRVWDAGTGKELFSGPMPHHVRSVTFSPDGRWVAAGSEKGVKVWAADSGKEAHALDHTGTHFLRVHFSPDGKFLVTGSDSGLKFWDAADGFRAGRTLETPAAWFAFPPDGKTVLTGCGYYQPDAVHTVIRWDMATGKQRAVLTLQGRGGRGHYRLSPDGKTLFAMRHRGSLAGTELEPDPFFRQYDAATGKELVSRQGHIQRLFTVAVSPDGKTVASAGEDRTIRLWDLATARLLHTLTGHQSTINHVRFSPDGKTLASGASDSTARLWDLTADPPRAKAVFRGHADWVGGVSFSPDGKLLASASADGTIKLWDSVTGRSLRTFRGHVRGPHAGHTGRENNVFDVAFSPDGRTLASVGQDETVRLWDVATGWEKHTLHRPGGPSGKLAWSADGRFLASYGEYSGEVRLWDVTGTAPRSKTIQLSPHLNGIAFTPEGRYLLTGNFDGTVYVLRLAQPGKVFEVPVAPEK